MLYRFAYLNSI